MCPIHAEPITVMLSVSEASNGACPEPSEGCEALDGAADAWRRGKSVRLRRMRFAGIQRGRPFAGAQGDDHWDPNGLDTSAWTIH